MRRIVALLSILGLALLSPAAANAVKIDNPGYVTAKYPTVVVGGVAVAPQSLDLSKGPVKATIKSTLVNHTNQVQKIEVNFKVHHIMTYDGKDVSDGTTKLDLSGDNYKRTTQKLWSSQKQLVTVAANGRTDFQFVQTYGRCGYDQVDINTYTENGDKYRLTGMFTRATGCPPKLEFGICHYAGKSGNYIYFPVPEQETAAYQHYRHLLSGTHENDYLATAEDRAHYDLHKNGRARPADSTGTTRKCVSTPPGGRPANKYDSHA